MWLVTHSLVSVGARLFPLLSPIFCLLLSLSCSIYLPLLQWYLSLMCPLPPSLSLSISGVQFCWPRGAGFSCGNKRGHPEGGSTHRFWDPAAGGCLCYGNPVCSPSHPLYWARQPSWEVTHWDTSLVNKYHIWSHLEPGCPSANHSAACEKKANFSLVSQWVFQLHAETQSCFYHKLGVRNQQRGHRRNLRGHVMIYRKRKRTLHKAKCSLLFQTFI